MAQAERWLAWGALSLFAVAVLRAAWVSDDAFITASSIRTWISGHGIGVNPDHRVQSFTSPLGFIVSALAYLVVDEPYAALVLPGLVCSFGLGLLLLSHSTAQPLRAAAVLLAFAGSTSMLAFSTSGLENSLAHLLIALFVFALYRLEPTISADGRLARKPRLGDLRWLLTAAALLVLTRFDLALIALPAVAYVFSRAPRLTLRACLPGLALLVAWFGFAVVYFGFPFPNTAYAKLNTAIPRGQLLLQGVTYLVDGFYRDPELFIVWLLALAVCARGPRLTQCMGAGSALYLAYVVWIGGDLMGGRFFTAPYAAAVVAAAFAPRVAERWALRVLCAAGLFLCLPALRDHSVNRHTADCVLPPSGIVDERECYIVTNALSQNIRQHKWRTHSYIADTKKIVDSQRPHYFVMADLVGIALFFKRERPFHVVERFALSEPLLARVTFVPQGKWRPGHFRRPMPDGYLESLRTGQNKITDPCIRRMHDRLQRVTRGPLMTRERWASIWALNFGQGRCPAPP